MSPHPRNTLFDADSDPAPHTRRPRKPKPSRHGMRTRRVLAAAVGAALMIAALPATLEAGRGGGRYGENEDRSSQRSRQAESRSVGRGGVERDRGSADRAAQQAQKRAAEAQARAQRQAQQRQAEAQRQAQRQAQDDARRRAAELDRARAQAQQQAAQARAAEARRQAELNARRNVRDHADHDRERSHSYSAVQRNRHDDHGHSGHSGGGHHVPSHDGHPYGRDKNGDGVHDHYDHHLKNPSNALDHSHHKHHEDDKHHYGGIHHGRDKDGDGDHDHFDHHAKNPSNAYKHSHYKHHDDKDDHRYHGHGYRYPYYRSGVYVGGSYSRCNHGYYGTTCNVCYPTATSVYYEGYYQPEVYRPNTAVIVTSPATRTVVEETVVESQPVTPPPPVYDGWTKLRTGDAAGAMREFEEGIAADPDAGIYRIGCSVSAALLELDEKALLAMRDAVQFAPGAMIATPQDNEIAQHLRGLIARYQQRSGTDAAQAGDDFMVAALAYLNRDFHLAHASIRTALASGDEHPATLQLKGMIDYQLQYTRDAAAE